MNRFGGMRHFIAFMCATCSVAFLPASLLDPAVPWTVTGVATLMPAYAMATIALYRTDNHGRGDTPRSRLQRRLAALLVGPIKPCGCWADAGSDTVESEPYVRRSMSGAQVSLEARKRQMRRCTSCGRHYHTTVHGRTSDIGNELELKSIDTGGSLGIHRETVVWPEDEPDAREHIDVPVERD